jgi:MoCo/4Fe-4S cofactor protein with predicted Tat translocation signal
MANTKKYWKGLEQLDNDSRYLDSTKNEFAEQLPVTEFLGNKEELEDATTTRRDFLKYLGFGVAAASLAACETPVTKAIPYLNKPEEITPGLANYYASTYFDGNDYAPILVKTREGRPIHIVGNKESKLTKGAINARVNSSVLSLYDNNRLKSPSIKGAETTWATIDNRLGKELKAAKSVRVLTGSIISPSTQASIDLFLGESTEENGLDNKHVVADAISYSGILDANAASFGKAVIPTYNFEKAKTIVSVGADYMGSWLDALQYVNDYTQTRKPSNDWMSKTFQFEASMSLTGTNTDVRVPVKPSEYGAIISSLYKHLGGKGGSSTPYDSKVIEAAAALKASKGESIVVCGSNDKNVQVLVNAINELLGNYGKTIDLNIVSNSKQGLDSEVSKLISDMNAGKVDALLIHGIDPVFTMGDAFTNAMKKVTTTVSFANKMNDTSAACIYVCPSNHALESWSDAVPVTGHYSLGQPTISPLFDTRQTEESLLKWSGIDSSYHDYIQNYCKENIFPKSGALMFTDFWNKTLHDGVTEFSVIASEALVFSVDISKAVSAVNVVKGNGIELELVQNMAVGAGVGADNPWLQELPDPITKITWDNYITMNPSEMEALGYEIHFGQENEMNVLDLTANGETIQLPVIAQPGQAKGTLGVALGYGKKVGNQEEITGANAYPLVTKTKTGVSYYASGVTTTNVELDTPYYIACTQTQQTVMGRDSVIKETTLDTYKKGDRSVFNPILTLLSGETDEHGHQKAKPLKEFDLWGDQPVKVIGHRWGMSIDMNSCTGCSACVTSCVSENNIAVIGKDQVRRGRIMHWMRIDRYYSSDYQPLGDIGSTHDKTKESLDVNGISAYTEMESADTDNPSVVHQPMMCQHCNHAGCETVCPVAATTHSNEGLNMMTYNRCIGTRYCANNCAYKVRRFNWFNYIAYSKFTDINPSQDDLGRMVLNPDVVVRSRGVMEKCSLCVQRIQEGKLDAKKVGTKVQDGAIQTACSSACPTNAITFGDHNDNDSQLAAERESDRSYRVIEEVGQDANVYYQTKVRNLKA